ncbi:MAG: amidophosphoribosyltransferase [Pseudomonadota bacterium]
MCGIVGLYLKNMALAPELGRLTALMLHEMAARGPDSTGFAVYGPPDGTTRLSAVSRTGDTEWESHARALGQALGTEVAVEPLADHALLRFASDADGSGEARGQAARNWLIAHAPDLSVLSVGQSIALCKGLGDPDEVAQRLGLAQRHGTHAIAHTRMATESAVTTEGSHPFSTGADTCLVHNGSLSNHNRLRANLRRQGETFQTENDSEVAAGYLAWRMREGDSLDDAIAAALRDFDGFFTFAIGTADGFAVVRDPIACKPAVIVETDDWVAMSSEFRAIAKLPGVEHAEIWEPEPARIYAWSHAA